VGPGGTGKLPIGSVTRIAVGTLTVTRAFLIRRSLSRYRGRIKEPWPEPSNTSREVRKGSSPRDPYQELNPWGSQVNLGVPSPQIVLADPLP
jgi:hypothetical protein